MKLKKEFSDFINLITIDSETNTLIEKRKTLQADIEENLPGILENHGISLNKSDIRIIDQGSYKYKTTIKSDVVDRDVAVIIPLDTFQNDDPRKIKSYLKDAIDIPSRTLTVKEPCIRSSYHENGKEWLHIDLPLYAEDGSKFYLARGKATSNNYSWQEADPDGLNDDLCKKINGHDQLRRIIRFVKKWRNIKYSEAANDHSVPPSIGITYLVCDHFSEQTTSEGDYDLLALQKTMCSIKNAFSCTKNEKGEVISADIKRLLPVAPYTDVFQKMRESGSNNMLNFYKRLSKAVEDLTNAVNVESEHDAGEYVQKVLGSEFVVPLKEASIASTNSKREHSFGDKNDH